MQVSSSHVEVAALVGNSSESELIILLVRKRSSTKAYITGENS